MTIIRTSNDFFGFGFDVAAADARPFFLLFIDDIFVWPVWYMTKFDTPSPNMFVVKILLIIFIKDSSRDYRGLLQWMRNFLNISTGIILLFIVLELNSSQSSSLLFVCCLLFRGSFYSRSDWTHSSQYFRNQARELHRPETVRLNLFRKVLFDHFYSAS